MKKAQKRLAIAVAVIIMVCTCVGAAFFLYTELLLAGPENASYKVIVKDMSVLDGRSLSLKVFGSYLIDGHEVVDVSSDGIGYIQTDFGTTVRVIPIVDGSEEDAYYTVPLGSWTVMLAGGSRVEIMITRMG